MKLINCEKNGLVVFRLCEKLGDYNPCWINFPQGDFFRHCEKTAVKFHKEDKKESIALQI